MEIHKLINIDDELTRLHKLVNEHDNVIIKTEAWLLIKEIHKNLMPPIYVMPDFTASEPE